MPHRGRRWIDPPILGFPASSPPPPPPPPPVVPIPLPEIVRGVPMAGAPWIHVLPLSGNTQPPAEKFPYGPTAPQIDRGPPMVGAPWFRLQPPSINSSKTLIPIPPAAIQSRPLLNLGPPVPGSPWALIGGKGQSKPPAPVPPPPPPPPPPPSPPPPTHVGNAKPFLAYDPGVDARLRRFTQVTTDVLNSLMRQGIMVQTGLNEWTILAPGIPTNQPGGGLSGTFESGDFGD